MKLKGIIPPLLTPFKETGEVDYDRIPLLVEFLKPHVDGFFVCGTYGSGPLMNLEERKKVFETVASCVDETYQLVAHVGSTNLRDTLQLIDHAAAHHALAVSAVPPFYYRYDEEVLFQYFLDLIRTAAVPVYLYDNPGTTGNQVSVATINRLAMNGLAGVKDSTFDIGKTYMVMRKVQREDFDVVIGSESLLLPAFSMGAQACISGLANVMPELMGCLFTAAYERNFEQAKELQKNVLLMWDILHYGPSSPTAYAMLKVRGIDAGFPRRPMLPLGEDLFRRVSTAMGETRPIWEMV